MPSAEDTPLLSENSWAIKPAAQTLRDHGLQSIFIQDICPAFTVNDPRKLSFALSVLLYLRHLIIHEKYKNKEPYEKWSQEQTRKTDVETIEENIKELWDLFLDSRRDSQAIEKALWNKFPLEDRKLKTVRVVDFLTNFDAPEGLAGHPVVASSLIRVWKQGLTVLVPPPDMTLAEKYDACCTPRVIHFLDTISDFAYLALLVHVLNSPALMRRGLSIQEIVLLVFTAGGLLRLRSAHKLSYALTALAYISSIPGPPKPTQPSFILLTLSMGVHIAELHLARYPSPVYLFPVDLCLPLVVYLRQKFAQALIPVLLYLLPAFLFSAYLLSVSVADTFLGSLGVFTPAPMETRVTYLIFSGLVATVATSCAVLISLGAPSITVDRWDRYSRAAGHEARISWFRIIVDCSKPNMFPSPLTFLQVPHLLVPSSDVVGLVERQIWRGVVGPFALVIYLIFVLLRM
ncbi:hypothetical protein AX15_001111 [Amanita polypyramis BW_CC]|nr:hypothetical protein AX15_001111 [Amanita polypyramis BW_CC]